MGRKGSKRRGRREAGGAAAVGSPPAKQTKLVPDGGDGDRRASSGRGGESLKAMPWTRWTGGELHNAKAEHQALANWKRGSFPSAAFEAYYRRQLSSHAPRGLLPEVEWPAFLSALRRPLPATFRLNPAHPAGATLLRRLRDGEFDLPPASTQQVHPTGVPIPPIPVCLQACNPPRSLILSTQHPDPLFGGCASSPSSLPTLCITITTLDASSYCACRIPTPFPIIFNLSFLFKVLSSPTPLASYS